MPATLPAVSLVAVPGRRRQTIEIAREIERRGFDGIFCPSLFASMSLCEALAWNTERVIFGPMIAPIYARTMPDFAQAAAFLHEVSAGRFRFGIGVAHAPSHARMGVTPGKPLADTRAFVEKLRARRGYRSTSADRPRRPCGARWWRWRARSAKAWCSPTPRAPTWRPRSPPCRPASAPTRRFFIGVMIPTCIADDIEAAKAVNRRTLTGYARLPNYRNYWKEAGYVEEMEAIERAIAEGREADIPRHLTDRWLDDVTLFGPASRVRERLDAWREAGVRTPIIVPSSASGNQMRAIEEMFAAFA